MNNHDQMRELRQEANQIYAKILATQLLMTGCIDELVGTVYVDLSLEGKKGVKDIQDRIFGYRIEMETMHARAQKLLEMANALDVSENE